MSEYTTKPAQFRLPCWAHEFLAQEASATGTSKTAVVLDALEGYKRKRLEELLAEGYREWADENLADAQFWAGTLADGPESEEW